MINFKICSFCHREDETIEHILWECNHVQSFLADFEYYVEEKTNLQLILSKILLFWVFLIEVRLFQMFLHFG